MYQKSLIKITFIILILLISMSPASAWLSVNVNNPTINFGTVNADGMPVYASSTITFSGNENFDFYIRANGPLTSINGNIIPNNPNFQYRIQYPKRSIDNSTIFNDNNQKLWTNWPKPNTGGSDVATGTYRLTVPPDTPGGNYTTTITFTVITSSITPTNVAIQTNNMAVSNSTGNLTNTTSNKTNETNSTLKTEKLTNLMNTLIKLF